MDGHPLGMQHPDVPGRGHDRIHPVWAEFVDPVLERRYRESRVGSTARRLVVIAGIGTGIALMFAGVEVATRGVRGSLPIVPLLVVLAALASSWGIAVHRRPRRALRYGVMTAFELAGIVALVLGAIADPARDRTLDLGVVVFLCTVYLGIPNRYRTTIAIGVVTLGAYTTLLLVTPSDGSPGTVALRIGCVSALVALVAANVNALEHARREEFSALLQAEAAAHELDWIATHDALTSVLNRRGFQRAATSALAAAAQAGTPVSLLVVDADGLKALNDRYGHDAGDEAIVAIAGHCSDVSRQSDVVGRLGGDEFALILAGVDRAHADGFAARLRRAVAAAEPTRGDMRLGVSVGIATSPPGGAGLEELLRHADAAMYLDKHGRAGASSAEEPAALDGP